jgi:hypothetical protein
MGMAIFFIVALLLVLVVAQRMLRPEYNPVRVRARTTRPVRRVRR